MNLALRERQLMMDAPLSDLQSRKTSLLLAYGEIVSQGTLTPLFYVQIVVSQPIIKRSIIMIMTKKVSMSIDKEGLGDMNNEQLEQLCLNLFKQCLPDIKEQFEYVRTNNNPQVFAAEFRLTYSVIEVIDSLRREGH